MGGSAEGGTGAGSRDMTTAEQALRSLPAGVLVAKAPAGEIVYINEYGRRLAGNEAVGRRLRGACMVQRIDGGLLQPEDRPLARAFAGQTVTPEALRLQRCTAGEWIEVRVSAAPIHDDTGTQVVGAVVCFEDVSARHTVEALRAADRRKDEFLALLAHELATPVNALSAALGVIAHGPDDPEVVQRTRMLMERQVRQIARLIDDLRDVAQIRTGKLGSQLQRLDLREAVQAAVETTAPLMEAARHRLHVALPQTAVWIHGDCARLVQVLTNLLANAAHHTLSPGMVLLSVEIHGEQALIEVRDTGAGIAPEHLDKIFELFWQADRDGHAGLGIGLHLARQLIEMHGGSIRAERTAQGTCFTVQLPRAG